MNQDRYFNSTYTEPLKGDNDRVTCLATDNYNNDEVSLLLVSGSRDRNLIVWELTSGVENVGNGKGEGLCGIYQKSLTGHNHFISDISIFALPFPHLGTKPAV